MFMFSCRTLMRWWPLSLFSWCLYLINSSAHWLTNEVWHRPKVVSEVTCWRDIMVLSPRWYCWITCKQMTNDDRVSPLRITFQSAFLWLATEIQWRKMSLYIVGAGRMRRQPSEARAGVCEHILHVSPWVSVWVCSHRGGVFSPKLGEHLYCSCIHLYHCILMPFTRAFLYVTISRNSQSLCSGFCHMVVLCRFWLNLFQYIDGLHLQ